MASRSRAEDKLARSRCDLRESEDCAGRAPRPAQRHFATRIANVHLLFSLAFTTFSKFHHDALVFLVHQLSRRRRIPFRFVSDF